MEFQFIGWNNQDGHDTIWTSFIAEGNYYVAWGRRGAKLQFKKHGHHLMWAINGVVRKIEQQKKEKGYKEVDKFLLFTLFPDFEEKVEQELMVGILGGKVR
jgi:hypothetical protein